MKNLELMRLGRNAFPCAIALAGALSFSQAQAVTVETTNFISSPTYFNGFESMGATTSYPSNTPYSEGGISVTYVGTFFRSGGGIWSTFTPTIGGQGNYGWYENGPTAGYTDVKLTGGGGIQEIQFLAGSGWFTVDPTTPTYMQYQVLNQGSVVLSGILQITRNLTGVGTMQYFGFSGGGFDEIRLENQATNPNNTFADFEFDAGAYDSFAANAAASTPLPAALPMFATGLGALGLLGWRRKRRAVSRAAA